MAEYTEKMTIAVTPELKQAIARVAAEQGRKPTAMARYTLERVYLADAVTVEQCSKDRQTWDEFEAGKVACDG